MLRVRLHLLGFVAVTAFLTPHHTLLFSAAPLGGFGGASHHGQTSDRWTRRQAPRSRSGDRFLTKKFSLL